MLVPLASRAYGPYEAVLRSRPRLLSTMAWVIVHSEKYTLLNFPKSAFAGF